ncbi:MAG: hypothetical protein HWE15_05675 [Algoriphagus sp.]|uniref:hypothetical protein n=1 Tax=Algoriphagus sp. TaxID=1872435 RepID=UPI00182B69B1|nr:hypothetical protein [Algoriphagus sp.]NVJ85775.1 hypothetical protein [Algoriphagus sp.]
MTSTHLKFNLLIIAFTLLLATSCVDPDTYQGPDSKSYLMIPDFEFESKLIELGIDTEGLIDQKILKTDAKKVTHLNFNESSNPGRIRDFSGLEEFENITFLAASGQEIENIDLSKNILLDTLLLDGNFLTNIDISNNPNLLLLDLKNNGLESFKGLSKAKNLITLNLSFNHLKEIRIDNQSVENLFITDNQLNSVDIRAAINLKSLLVTSNLLEDLNLSFNQKLETLIISNNKLSSISLESNPLLRHLYISSNTLSGLDISHHLYLTSIRADRNPKLTCIKINENQEIPSISISDYQQLSSECD